MMRDPSDVINLNEEGVIGQRSRLLKGLTRVSIRTVHYCAKARPRGRPIERSQNECDGDCFLACVLTLGYHSVC